MGADEHEVIKHSLIVMGKPVAQPRHRATIRGGYVRMYLPSDHPVQRYKQRIIDEAKRQKIQRIEGPVRLDILFSFAAPKRMDRHFKISKPDLDNLEKAVMDALTNAGVWCDDAQVVEKHSTKMHAAVDATSIFVSSLPFPLKERR